MFFYFFLDRSFSSGKIWQVSRGEKVGAYLMDGRRLNPKKEGGKRNGEEERERRGRLGNGWVGCGILRVYAL